MEGQSVFFDTDRSLKSLLLNCIACSNMLFNLSVADFGVGQICLSLLWLLSIVFAGFLQFGWENSLTALAVKRFPGRCYTPHPVRFCEIPTYHL